MFSKSLVQHFNPLSNSMSWSQDIGANSVLVCSWNRIFNGASIVAKNLLVGIMRSNENMVSIFELSRSINGVDFQWLESWFSDQRILGILRCVAKIFLYNFGKVRKIFAKVFKILEEIHKKVLEFLARKSRISKVLARETRTVLDFLPRNFLVLEISCQDLVHYSWKDTIDFARLFKILERNPRYFSKIMARKPRLFKILARETRNNLHQCNIRNKQSPRKL